MTSHLHLRIDKATTAGKIDDFLLKARSGEESLGALHLRAYETTYRLPGGEQCKVTILYLRTGRESPLEWLRNTFNRKSQYGLAAKVLRDVGQFDVDALGTLPHVNSTCPKFKAAPTPVKPADHESGVLLSALLPYSALSSAIPQPALVTLGPDGFVKNQQIDPIDCLGRDMRLHATKSALNTSENLLKSMAKLSSAPAAKGNFAKFLNTAESDIEEFEENLESFTSLAAILYDSNLPSSAFVEYIEKTPDLPFLLNGAAKFSLRWAKCWDLNTDLHNEMPYSQVAMIDRFVIWIAKNYLSQHLDCDALEALAQWSRPASELVDINGRTALSAKKMTT